MRRTKWMHAKLPLSLLPILLMLGTALAGCGKANPGSSTGGGSGSGASDTVNMDPTNFTQHTISVAVNQPVHFSDNTDGGGLHILCVGTAMVAQARVRRAEMRLPDCSAKAQCSIPARPKTSPLQNPAPTTSSAPFIRVCISTSRCSEQQEHAWEEHENI